jgi:hypothetical protein
MHLGSVKFVIPAKAGIHEHGKFAVMARPDRLLVDGPCSWIPAFAGMTL